uniref:Uncharacterized protein n=1 Tax=Pyricularia oryzae (strain P131) TaxID=1143193 RepID=L7J809_PYRO1
MFRELGKEDEELKVCGVPGSSKIPPRQFCSTDN